ncbi:MAG TPA: ZIP family metal transporter [Patescibacteria group bacterium]
MPMNYALSSFLSVILVSAVSLIGIFFLFIKTHTLNKITLVMVSFAVGSLLGDAFIHLMPESFDAISNHLIVSLLFILGILLFFSMEKILRWRHCHDPEAHDCLDHIDDHSVIALNLVGDSFHNFIDGMLITASFIVSPSLGISTTLAVVIHEIPQEMGHFGIFLHHGLQLKKAIVLNTASALVSLLGVVFTLILGRTLTGFSDYLLPVTAGGFIYLASSDLIPELHRHDPKITNSLIQLGAIICGVLLMVSLLVIG